MFDQRIVDTVGAGPENNGKHVVQRATTGVRLRVNRIISGTVEFLQEDRRLEIKDARVLIDSALVQPNTSDPAMLAPLFDMPCKSEIY